MVRALEDLIINHQNSEDVIISHQNSEGNKEGRRDWTSTPILHSYLIFCFQIGSVLQEKAILTQTLINLNICKMNS